MESKKSLDENVHSMGKAKNKDEPILKNDRILRIAGWWRILSIVHPGIDNFWNFKQGSDCDRQHNAVQSAPSIFGQIAH
ncbi:hypothetical protein RRG08_007012 [Elysia crispata]|uniref:Uncharacterized protein n=1 Tax=Elysia crispata TaxID=231223 RepID=A0AAE1DHL0_9GAST|nr:hypothetical protein RRG08_007012 [Elysia crispata]